MLALRGEGLGKAFITIDRDFLRTWYTAVPV